MAIKSVSAAPQWDPKKQEDNYAQALIAQCKAPTSDQQRPESAQIIACVAAIFCDPTKENPTKFSQIKDLLSVFPSHVTAPAYAEINKAAETWPKRSSADKANFLIRTLVIRLPEYVPSPKKMPSVDVVKEISLIFFSPHDTFEVKKANILRFLEQHLDKETIESLKPRLNDFNSFLRALYIALPLDEMEPSYLPPKPSPRIALQRRLTLPGVSPSTSSDSQPSPTSHTSSSPPLTPIASLTPKSRATPKSGADFEPKEDSDPSLMRSILPYAATVAGFLAGALIFGRRGR